MIHIKYCIILFIVLIFGSCSVSEETTQTSKNINSKIFIEHLDSVMFQIRCFYKMML